MRVLVPTLAVLTSLSACGGGGEDEEASSQVFKTMGSLQCTGGGVSLSDLQAQLTAANVQVRSAACGTDGMFPPAVCGASDTRIGIFEISPSQAEAAAAAGFKPLSTAPKARIIPCT